MVARSLEAPPLVPWQQWYASEMAQIKQGMHILFCGPTQSGKTLLCRAVTRLHNFTVVFGTKAVDPSLDEYIAEGYTRIDHWPPTRADMRKQRETWTGVEAGSARFILWPKIKKREDLRRFRDLYVRCMDQAFIEGCWTLVIDEGLWIASKDGLDLGDELSAIAFGAASNKVSMHLLVQRPANVPPITWTSCTQALLFHLGRDDDVGNLASMGTYPRPDAIAAMRTLKGHQFLDLPCRGNAEWAISEVDPSAVAVA